jgi:hypothetical protein
MGERFLFLLGAGFNPEISLIVNDGKACCV